MNLTVFEAVPIPELLHQGPELGERGPREHSGRHVCGLVMGIDDQDVDRISRAIVDENQVPQLACGRTYQVTLGPVRLRTAALFPRFEAR